MLTKLLYHNDICHCGISSKATTIVVVKTLIVAATSNVFANFSQQHLYQLHATTFFLLGKSIFGINIVFFL